ncbi:MAG: hypothetical protein Q9168_002273 [Polycauliona sp. 1 TL-2023]
MSGSEDQVDDSGSVDGGGQDEAFIASMCQPVNVANQPDLNFPCNRMILYTAPCLYGKSYTELSKAYVNRSLPTPDRLGKDQYHCFCDKGGVGQGYWQNAVRAAALQDYVTMWNATGTIGLGTSTGGLNVGNYGIHKYDSYVHRGSYVDHGSDHEYGVSPGNDGSTGHYDWDYGIGRVKLQCRRFDRSFTESQPYFLREVRPSVITTSSHKKRKLSPPYQTEGPSSASSSAVHDPSPSLHHTLSSPSPPSHRELPRNVTSSPAPSGLLPQPSAFEETTADASPTTASSPSAACAHLTIENEGLQELAPTPDTVGSKGRLNSLSIAEAGSGPFLSARSSSPAKRPASQMDGTHSGDPAGNPADDVEMEDTLTRATPGRRLSASREPAKAQRRKSLNQQNRHVREMSLDPLASDSSPAEGASLPDRSRPTSSAFPNGAYHTPQSGASTTSTPQGGVSTARPSSGASDSEIPSIDNQIERVLGLANRPLQEGQKGFVISYRWLSRVMARGSNPDFIAKYGKEAAEGPIGPVDNSGVDMVVDQSMKNLKDEKGQPFIPIRPELSLGEDFEILPEEAWELIIGWYGLAQGSPIITRYCHNTSSSDTVENFQYELRPPIFTIVKIPDTRNGPTKQSLDESDALPIKILASRHKYFQSFLKDAKQGARINIKTKVRTWRILAALSNETQGGMITPAQTRSNSPALNTAATPTAGDALILDVSAFAKLSTGSERELIEAKDETANENYNGHLTLDTVGLGQDGVIVLEEQIGGPAGGEWVAEAAITKAKSNGVPLSITKAGATKVQNNLKTQANNSRAASPASGGMMTRGRARKDGRTRGTVGLSNLGNTCYMNSALQCIRSCEELSMYFLQDHYKRELNPSNPLAHNGMVAKAYSSLIREMYGDGGYAFAPKAFKNVIGKYGPSFSGYGQQDSQEFLLFLLDGLQEDLNRIQKKPYIEKPDSTDEMVNNPAALREMAAKCWEIYKARNDSVITDLFAGMYKSTVVCPVCDKVSIIFDPFNNLTLQLPIENVWSRDIEYYPVHSEPFKISVDIDKNSAFSSLKELVAGKVGTDAKRLIAGEVYRNKFYKVFKDGDTIGEERIADNDVIVIYELEDVPTNWPRPKKPGRPKPTFYVNNSASEEDLPDDVNSPQADRMLVTVHHRLTRPGLTRNQQHRSLFGVPGLIIVTRDEAKDYEEILRKVLGNIATLTSREFLREFEDSDQSPEDSDTVLMGTEEGGDSSSDSKVQANSVDGEDGMVDISMAQTMNGKSRTRYPPSRSQAKPLPKMLQPGSFILPEVKNLFSLKYNACGETISPAFSNGSSEEGKELPTIESRKAPTSRPQRRPTKAERRMHRLDSASSSDEDLIEAPEPVAHSFQASSPGSGSDDEDLPPVQQLIQPSHQGFSRFTKNTPRTKKGLITYSRQDKNRSASPIPEEIEGEPQGEQLLHLGEQIYVDWAPDGYEALFGGTRRDGDLEMRGAPTYDDMPLRPDPELDEKRRLRAQRRKNGVTLNDCLDEFGRAETLSENDAWYCPRCKEHRRASKTFELWSAPDILVIHLKRFASQGRMRDKLDVTVDFPVEGLDLTHRVASQEDGKSPIYDLFAVDNHYGGLGGGHYTAYAQNFYDKGWYEYNDSAVSRCRNPHNVVSNAAYLLFYRRRTDCCLGGPFFESIMSGADESAADSQPTSDTASPAGEGKRLDGSSRNGSSSALHGVGAAHQTGGGGDGLSPRTGVDDELPSYSRKDNQEATLESMDLDEGIADIYSPLKPVSPYRSGGIHESWSFSRLGNDENIHVVRAPAASENNSDEGLFEGDSTKAETSPSSEVGDRLADFADDEGTTSGAFGPPGRGESPLQVEVEPPLIDDDDDEPVVEVTLPEGDSYV